MPSSGMGDMGGDGMDMMDMPKSEEKFEPTPLQLWEEKRATVLEERESASEQKKQDALQRAAEEFARYLEIRGKRIEETKKAHRDEAARQAESLEKLMAHGTKWAKVEKLVNLKPNKEKSFTKTERMRKLLITLKNERKEQAEQ